jgi:uncharacterized membrane protein YkoI
MKSSNSRSRKSAWTIAVVIISIFTWFGLANDLSAADSGERVSKFQSKKDYSDARDWNLKGENLRPTGYNPYYIPFTPGFKFIMERPDHPDGYYRKEVTVLHQTEPFDLPGIGKFYAAVIQEEEFFDGRWTQQALNWEAIDITTNTVYSLGEVSWEVDEEGNKTFDGTWRAGEPDGGGPESPNADPAILMPGTFLIGARYLFDGSESEAIGGTENIERGVTITVPAGTFKNCVRTREQSLNNLKDVTDKVYCPGVGLVFDTSDGKLVASDALPNTDTSSFGKFHRAENMPKVIPPVAKVTGGEATEIALKKVPGKANSLSIERKKGKNVYVVEIIEKSSGQERDVFVDIESGEVVGTD